MHYRQRAVDSNAQNLQVQTCLNKLPIQLRRHNVDRAQHRDDVGEHVALDHFGHGRVVDEAGRAGADAPGAVVAARDDVVAELAVGGFLVP